MEDDSVKIINDTVLALNRRNISRQYYHSNLKCPRAFDATLYILVHNVLTNLVSMVLTNNNILVGHET